VTFLHSIRTNAVVSILVLLFGGLGIRLGGEAIGQGRLVPSQVPAGGESGQLAVAVNQMTEGLRLFRDQLLTTTVLERQRSHTPGGL